MTNSQKGTGPDKLMQIWSRRKWLAILAFMVPFTGALSLAAFLPDLYRATTTLVVKQAAAAVANTLAASYIEENTRMRGQQARDTAATLKSQLDEMKKRQEEQEKRVREFKLKHMGELPQQVETNLSMIERLNSQLALNNDKQ